MPGTGVDVYTWHIALPFGRAAGYDGRKSRSPNPLGGSTVRRSALTLTLAFAALAGLAPHAGAQDTPSAKATRKRLQEKISIDLADVRLKDALDDLKRELSKPISFKLDNVSGISNNSKVTYTAKDKTVEQILNDLCDKYDMGYVVQSKANDRYDGWVILRKGKGKERGYEAGKEPKQEGGSVRHGEDPPARATLTAAGPAVLLPRP
jgi:hypothetical protein